MGGLIHWLNVELWAPMWPNMVAPSVWTIFGVLISHFRLKHHLRNHHEELKQHVTGHTEDLKQHVTDTLGSNPER